MPSGAAPAGSPNGPDGPVGPTAPVPLSGRVLAPVPPVPGVEVPPMVTEPPTVNSSLVRIDSATETSIVVSVN